MCVCMCDMGNGGSHVCKHTWMHMHESTCTHTPENALLQDKNAYRYPTYIRWFWFLITKTKAIGQRWSLFPLLGEKAIEVLIYEGHRENDFMLIYVWTGVQFQSMWKLLSNDDHSQVLLSPYVHAALPLESGLALAIGLLVECSRSAILGLPRLCYHKPVCFLLGPLESWSLEYLPPESICHSMRNPTYEEKLSRPPGW